MAQLTSDVLALQLEAVRDTLPILYEYNDFFFSLIETRKDLMKVSSRAARIPIQDQPGSRFGSVNLAGGVLGRGTATHYDVPTITALSSRIAVDLSGFRWKQRLKKLAISVKLSPRQHRGNLREQRVRRDYTRAFLREDDIVRTYGRP